MLTFFRTLIGCRASPFFRPLGLLAFGVAMFGSHAFAFDLNVVDSNGAPVTTGYRWLVEEDTTTHAVPGVSAANIQAFQFHASWMPPVATGTEADIGSWNPYPAGASAADLKKNYFITVLPNFTQDQYGTYFASYNLSSAPILAAHRDGNNTLIPAQTSATVIVHPSPLVASQVIVLAYEDNKPLNGQADQDREQGLAGFSVRIDDGGGRYGQIGGQISADVFGSPLGTTYLPDATNPSGYAIDPKTHLPTPDVIGNGVILTDADGYALIKNLPPGKYGVTLLPPNGTDWIQTSTIEGQHANDAWLKFHEAPYFAEFGPPGPHIAQGFISPTRSMPAVNALIGGATVTGRITVNHMNPPPHYGFNSGAPIALGQTGSSCWVGLNQVSSNQAVFVGPCNPDGTFSIANVPAGDYRLAVFDTALDLIHGNYGFTVDEGAATCNNGTVAGCALGDVPQFTWFHRIEAQVFYDQAQKGFPITGAPAIPEIPVSIKFRDGTTDQTFKTKDPDGKAYFNETFPYFNWQVIEIDNSRFKATGVTVVVDAGGAVPGDSGWNQPSIGKLTPQPQYNTLAANGAKLAPGAWTAVANSNTGNNLSRTETSTPSKRVTTEAFQGFTTGTTTIAFGKSAYGPNENGGIAGTVNYATVRAENDPRYAVTEGLEPGIPHVAVIIYPKPAAGQTINLADIASFTNATLQNQITNNANGTRKPAANGALNPAAGDVKRSKTGAATTFDYGDAIAYGWTDGWDDNLPTNCQNGFVDATGTYNPEAYTVPLASAKRLDCYDGLRSWNQMRPGTYDGKYSITTSKTGTALPPGDYVVEVFAPRYGNNPSPYKTVKSEDKNVFFGVDFVPAALPPACVGSQQTIDPNQYWYGVTAATTKTPAVNPAYYPFDQPNGHKVPDYLALFPVQDPNAPAPANWPGGAANWQPQPPGNKAAPLAGQTLPLCMFKSLTVSNGQNATAKFEFFTDVPIAGHFVGVILNDLGNEFDVTAPNFGEKQAPPWVPVAIRDSNGQELYRVYADEWGTYSGLVPSTMTANVPIPTGNSPSVMTLCMNDPGPIPDPANPGQTMIDPNFLKQFSQFCYTLSYLQGTTTYLDTPVVPVAAFSGLTVDQLDCEFVDGTPKVYSVFNTNPTGATVNYAGPVIPGDSNGSFADATLTIVSSASTKVLNPMWQGPGSGTPANETRDYGFGPAGTGANTGTISIGGVNIPLVLSGKGKNATWTNKTITITVPKGTKTGELVITRGDNKKSTVTSVTVVTNASGSHITTVQPPVINPIANNAPTPISDAIAAASPGDVIVLPPGLYQEMVIMTKPVQIAGAGPESVAINPAKTRTDALRTWRKKIEAILTSNPPGADLLAGQALDFTIPEPGTLNTEEGAGIVVLGQAGAGPNHTNDFSTFPSRIDGVKIFGADNGGAITVNGYAHNIEISNTHVTSNAGAYGGGIRIGVPLLVSANANGADVYSSSFNDNVNIHHNSVTTNGGQGTSGGGVHLCTGADNYKVQYNFICGNFNIGNGGGIGHEGLINNGLIDHNTIVFNQVFNQSSSTNGGGISIASEAALGAQRTGSGSVMVSNNIIQGNQSGSGNGGGIYLEAVNGADVAANPGDPTKWFSVTMLNNMITNNQAGRAGGGIALQDVAQSGIVNNTIANNESTATTGDAFPPGQPFIATPSYRSRPQVGGIVSFKHSPALLDSLRGRAGPLYARFSNPDLRNDIIFENRSFFFRVKSLTPGDYGLFPNAAKPNWDLDVQGVAGSLSPSFSLLTSTAGYDATNIAADPAFRAAYFNAAPGSKISALGVQQPEPTTGLPLVQPAFDEGGNFIDQVYWPLTQTIYDALNATTKTQWSYVPKGTTAAPSPGACKGSNAVLGAASPYGTVLATDVSGVARLPACVDIGAAQQAP